MKVPLGVGPGMVTWRVLLRAEEVLVLKAILEAHDGLAQVFGEHGGDLVIAGHETRAHELAAVIADLARELGFAVSSPEGRPRPW